MEKGENEMGMSEIMEQPKEKFYIVTYGGERIEVEAEIIGGFAVHKTHRYEEKIELFNKEPWNSLFFPEPQTFTVSSVKSGIGLGELPSLEQAKAMAWKLNTSKLDWNTEDEEEQRLSKYTNEWNRFISELE